MSTNGMKIQRNARLTAITAAVAVAAVAVGGAVAYRQVPRNVAADNSAAPLTTPSTTPTSTPTPTPTAPTPIPAPTRTPSLQPTPSTPPPTAAAKPSTPKPPPANQVEIPIDLAALTTGRSPKVAYRIGREVRGGGHPATKIPTSEQLVDFARLGKDLFVIVRTDGVDILLTVSPGQKTKRTPSVETLVTNAAGTAAAYVRKNAGTDGIPTLGGTVYYVTAAGTAKQLELPANALGPKVLGLIDGKVYFESTDGHPDNPDLLYRWDPGSGKVEQVKNIESAVALSADGRFATALIATANGDLNCTTVHQVATGKKLWQDCKANLTGFTPDGAVTIGWDYIGNTPMMMITARSTNTGKLIHSWTGFLSTATAEDNEHILITTEGGAGGSLVRCAISTGACEYAVAPTGPEVRVKRVPIP